MKLKAVIALSLAAIVTTPALAKDGSFTSKLNWAADVGTHIYDMDNAETFKPSLELGIRASFPLNISSGGTTAIEAGLSQTVIYGTSELDTPQAFEGNNLETVQMDFRRLFIALSFETNGKWFFKPQVGFEHISSKNRLYDPNTKIGFTTSDSDSNVYGSLGVGYRFPSGQKGVLSIATLGDVDDFDDYRITYTASF